MCHVHTFVVDCHYMCTTPISSPHNGSHTMIVVLKDPLIEQIILPRNSPRISPDDYGTGVSLEDEEEMIKNRGNEKYFEHRLIAFDHHTISHHLHGAIHILLSPFLIC